MRPELDGKLCNTYPKLFSDRHADKMTTCMCWGFECEDGWFEIIDTLCKKVQFVCDLTGSQVVATQVKNKHGMLNFYTKFDHENIKEGIDLEIVEDIVEDLCSHAWNQSQYICEYCGKYGKIRERAWIQPICDKCWKEIECCRQLGKILEEME